MRSHLIRFVLAAVAVLAFSTALLAQTVKQPDGAKAPAKTSTADFSGVWQGPNFAGAKGRGFGFTVEAPPMQPWAEEKFKANHDPERDPNYHGRENVSPALRCFPPGPTWLLAQFRPFEILQLPGRVLMIFQWDHWVRTVWRDGRKHPEDLDPTWMGHSIGKWDGDTLVVDTVGLNDKTWLDPPGHPHSDALHVVERWRRPDQHTLVVDVTFDDPKAYTKSWTGQRTYQFHPDWEIGEEVPCEEHLLHEHGPL